MSEVIKTDIAMICKLLSGMCGRKRLNVKFIFFDVFIVEVFDV